MSYNTVFICSCLTTLFLYAHVLQHYLLGGERRFAATVAKRLESLGALTQGDRAATVGAQTMRLSDFNFDTRYGYSALRRLFSLLARRGALPDQDSLDEEQIASLKEVTAKWINGSSKNSLALRLRPDKVLNSEDITIPLLVTAALLRVGLDVYGPEQSVSVSRFLNRILGLESIVQNLIFDTFARFFAEIVRHAKLEGNYDTGILEVTGEASTPPAPILTPASQKDAQSEAVLHWRVRVDRGVSWEESLQRLAEFREAYHTAQRSNGEGNRSSRQKHVPVFAYYVSKNPFAGAFP